MSPAALTCDINRVAPPPPALDRIAARCCGNRIVCRCLSGFLAALRAVVVTVNAPVSAPATRSPPTLTVAAAEPFSVKDFPVVIALAFIDIPAVPVVTLIAVAAPVVISARPLRSATTFPGQVGDHLCGRPGKRQRVGFPAPWRSP